MTRRVGVQLQFPGDADPTDVTSLLRDGTGRFSERLFNDDKRSVQDVFSFALKHDQDLVDKVRSATGRVLVYVEDLDLMAPAFTGALDPSASQATTQVAESVSFEAIDSTWMLDEPVAVSFEFPVGIGSAPYKVCDPADAAHSIFHQVCYMAGYSAEQVVPTLASTATVLHCAAKAGDETYRDFLDGLLFEYGLVLDDDEQGRMTVRKWTRTAAGYEETVQSGELSTVVPFTWERRYVQEDGIKVEWAATQVMDDALLYRDSLPVSADGIFTGKPIAPGDYYPPDSDIEDTFQGYVEGWLDKPYLERQTRLKNRDISLVTTDTQAVAFQAEAGVVVDLEEYEPHRARVRLRNTSGDIKKVFTFEVRGRALFRSAVRTVLAPEGATKPKIYTSRFLFDYADAANLANALALDILYGDFEYTFGLNRYVASGTVIRLISEKNDIDTQAVIQECTYDVGRPVYQYRAVGLAEYSVLASTSTGQSGAALWPLIQAIEAQIVTDVAAPPANNVTDVVFASSQNADGTVHITATWDYAQGADLADLAYVYMKASIGEAPGAFDYGLDKAEAQPMHDDGSYGWSGNYPVRTGGTGGAAIHYQFGVVAANGVILHVSGAVIPAGWDDKIFASSIQFDDNNYWDLTTGIFRSGNAGSFLKIDPSVGTVELSGLDLELTESELITIAGGITLSHEGDALVWRNASDQSVLLTFDGRIKQGGTSAIPTFTSRTMAPSTRTWAQAAWSPRRKVFAAVGDSTDCATSTDGITWTNRTISAVMTWKCITWSETLGKFLALTQSYSATSLDGAEWQVLNNIGPRLWRDVKWIKQLGLFVAVAMIDTVCATSPDGINWTERTISGTARNWRAIEYSPELNLLLMTASGSAVCATSPDGINWTERTISGTARDWMSAAWSSALNLFVMVSTGTICATSPDGVAWTERTLLATSPQWQWVIWSAERGMFVAMAYSTTKYATSPDGIAWTERALSITRHVTHIAYAPETGVIVAIGGFTTLGITSGEYPPVLWAKPGAGIIETGLTDSLGAYELTGTGSKLREGAGIVESGSNDGGYYVKFSDGTLQQYTYGNKLMTRATNTVTYVWTFPIPFVDANSYGVSWFFMENTSGIGSYNSSLGACAADEVTLVGYTSVTTGSSYCRAMAIGRWK